MPTNLVFIGWNWVMSLDNKYGKDTNAIEKMIGTIPTGFIGIGNEDDSSTLPLLA